MIWFLTASSILSSVLCDELAIFPRESDQTNSALRARFKRPSLILKVSFKYFLQTRILTDSFAGKKYLNTNFRFFCLQLQGRRRLILLFLLLIFYFNISKAIKTFFPVFVRNLITIPTTTTILVFKCFFPNKFSCFGCISFTTIRFRFSHSLTIIRPICYALLAFFILFYFFGLVVGNMSEKLVK